MLDGFWLPHLYKFLSLVGTVIDWLVTNNYHRLNLAAPLWPSLTLATLPRRQEDWALAPTVLSSFLSCERKMIPSLSIPSLPPARPIALSLQSASVIKRACIYLFPSWTVPMTRPRVCHTPVIFSLVASPLSSQCHGTFCHVCAGKLKSSMGVLSGKSRACVFQNLLGAG